jgi:uncharacterized membrane protein YccC
MRRDEDMDQIEEVEDKDPAGDESAEGVEGASGILGFVGGLVLGALIGAGVALLVAPERGSKLRRRLVRRFSDARDDLRGELDDLRQVAQRRLSRRRRLRRRLGHVVS